MNNLYTNLYMQEQTIIKAEKVNSIFDSLCWRDD